MAHELAHEALQDILAINRIAIQEIIFDFFRIINRDGQFIEPLLLGMMKSMLIVIRRKRKKHFLPVAYQLIPLKLCQISLLCIHRREIIILVLGNEPIRAVIFDNDRSAEEMNRCWQKWSDFSSRSESSATLINTKDKIKQGSYKLKKPLNDFFQDHFFKSRNNFQVDENYFLFWLRNEQKIIYTREILEDESSLIHESDSSERERPTGCCDWLASKLNIEYV